VTNFQAGDEKHKLLDKLSIKGRGFNIFQTLRTFLYERIGYSPKNRHEKQIYHRICRTYKYIC